MKNIYWAKLFAWIGIVLGCSGFWLAVWLFVLAIYWIDSPLPGWLQQAAWVQP